MPNNLNEDPNEINIEDLLRFKRSERPSESFWNEFDRELHHRMLQTLVKKDPWYLQVVRGFTGRIPQAAALAGAAAVAMALVVRPAMLGTAAQGDSTAAVASHVDSSGSAEWVQVAMADLSHSVASAADYQIDAISAADAVKDSGFERDFGMDAIQVADNGRADYSADSAFSRVTFGNTGVASLVF